MGMTTTMLQEEIAKLNAEKRNRAGISELFYQRIFNIIEHVKYDINTFRENALINIEDLRDLYMLTDMYLIQLEEVADKIKTDPCQHINIRGVNGSKICESCGISIA